MLKRVPLHYPGKLRRLLCFHTNICNIIVFDKQNNVISKFQCLQCDKISKYEESFNK